MPELEAGRSAPRLVGACVLLAAVALGTGLRVETTLRQPAFDPSGPQLTLKSDPALLFYITQRIVEAGGVAPADFRADPRIEHPEPTDVPAMFTVGIEYLAAWVYLLLGDAASLLFVCVFVSSLLASLGAVGVYGLSLELTGRVRWAILAVLLFTLSIASYRTLGFVLMREDLSLPLFAAHLWLLARAARVRTPAAIALSALALLGALATWHAMGFVASLEAACLFAWFLRTGQNPLAARGAWIFPTLVALGSLAVPVLRAKLFLLSPPMQVAAVLGVAAAARHRSGVGPRSGALVGVGALVACAALAFGLTRVLSGALGDYGHVLELMWSKLRFGGVLPDDPEAISFGARLLWQGPFETGSLASLVTRVGAPAVLLPVAVLSALPVWWRGRGDSRMALLAGLLVAAVAASLLVRRLEVLVGLLAPVAAAALLRDLRPEKATAWIAGLLLVQAATFAPRIAAYTTDSWYPPRYQAELRQIVDWIARELPPDGAIAADFVTSTSVLAYTGHPVVLQPKYETRRSRDRIEAFCRQLYRGSPAEFARWLREEVDARYLLVDVQILWPWRYQCGLPRSSEAPPAGSAAAALMDPDLSKVEALRDFRLRYRNAEPPHAWRLFEIEGHAPGSGAP